MRMNTMANAEEKKFLFSLMVITGSALAISDQYNTIGEDAWVYQNKELIELNQVGFYAKPLSGDVNSRNSSRWIGQLPNGSWVVGLFNREDVAIKYTVNFSKELGFNASHVANVRDLWEHKDLGGMDNEYSVLLSPHSCKIIRIEK